MLPIFNEYIEFLKYKGLPNSVQLNENEYWLDNGIIKCFIKGVETKVCKLTVDDELNIKFKVYQNQISFFKRETFEDTYQRLKADILTKETESLEIINKYITLNKNHKPLVLTSSGKDSGLTQFLVEKCCEPIKVFNNTSLDCADTYKFIKNQKDIIIINPKEGFYQWQKRLNYIPTRINRACCGIFKEGEFTRQWNDKDKLLIFLGMRNEESGTRKNYNFEWNNTKWGGRDWKGILPIKNWTELELWLYTLHNNIPFNIKYKKGYNRVGCSIACPFYRKSVFVLDDYWSYKARQRWLKILDEDFVKNEKWCILNCTRKEYQRLWNGDTIRTKPNEEVLTEFMEHKGIEDINIARQYFNKTCKNCFNKKGNPKAIYKKDEIAMNLKMCGRNVNKFLCKKCLMKELNIDKEKWDEMVASFKQQNCNLF